MIGVAPVMYVGNQTSIMATFAVDHGWDIFLEEHFMSILWIKKGASILSDIIVDFAPTFLELVPRTTWAFVQGIVGFDKASHMDTK